MSRTPEAIPSVQPGLFDSVDIHALAVVMNQMREEGGGRTSQTGIQLQETRP